jgi:hypothetical protein
MFTVGKDIGDSRGVKKRKWEWKRKWKRKDVGDEADVQKHSISGV